MSDKPFYIPPIETHLIDSKYVNQTYQIQIMQPLIRKGANERFPVLYLTDGNLAFDVCKGIAHGLQATGQVRRFILVGIGYPGQNPFAGNVLRFRDMTPASRAESQTLTGELPIEGVLGVQAGQKRWHGGADFLAFIRDPLSAFIDDAYPALPGDRSYFGHSLGGGLGLHALFTQADIFSRYIISSPSLSYEGDDFGLREAQEFIASGKHLDAQVFMTVADGEEFETHLVKSQFVSSFYRLAALLRKAKIPGLDFSSRVFADESHISVWPIAFSHGVQAIYGAADPPLQPC